MPSTRWRTIKSLFNAAIELPMDRRADYLDRSCPDDVEIRNEVNSLLEHHAASSCFIEPPDIHSVARAFESAEIRSRVGHRVGAYELIRLLDTGGMGHVYLAQRADGQFDKQVAIKVIRRSVDHEELRLRFINEQKALASLEHPNIARLLDGGITGDGLSYLVMEYVEGCPIDEYCDLHRLSTEKRLEIFRAVCAAVHYAHQRLIIHRDLKPANILVTADGAPKLLDFGIAKLLDPQEPVRPKAESGEDPPAFAARPKTGNLSIPFLTPEYASPEQIRGEPITTASDIYSLGVILYELLAGRRPFRIDSRAQHEIARQICAEEPIKPSTAVRQIPFSRSDGAASQSKCSPQTLKRRLAGDLDNICLMALRKEPERRYGSVEQFAEDVRRHLIGLPVIARKDTFSYRAAKFVRRNRAAVIASSILFLALVGGIVGTSMTLLIVQRAQDKTLLMNDFLKQMIAEADVNSVGRDLTVRARRRRLQ
ncbi:MAG: serine/threonine protein kinase [Planctomycetes bacterium]|nr:serine/threonine protein kinase [Planctomycetota bacterium]